MHSVSDKTSTVVLIIEIVIDGGQGSERAKPEVLSQPEAAKDQRSFAERHPGLAQVAAAERVFGTHGAAGFDYASRPWEKE